MFRLFIFIITILFHVSAWAQHTVGTKDAEREFNQFQTLYKTASAYKDTANMLTGMIGMVGIKPRDTTYLKTLGKLYAAHQNYLPALIACHKYIDIVPDDIEMLELTATSAQNVFNYDYALLLYTELYYRTKNPEFKYFAAHMEYEMYRKEDCLKTINFCLQIPGVETKLVSVRSSDGRSQLVPLKAVCMHLMGLEYVDMNEIALAKNAFGEALKIFPDFIAAQVSLIEADKLPNKK